MERNSCRRTSFGQIAIWWCLVISIFIKSPCVCSDSDEESVSIYPRGDIFVTYGTDLEIFCTAGNNSTSKDLVFTKSNIVLDSEIVNETTIRLFQKKPPEQKSQTIFCKNNKTKRNQVVTVVVGSPPADVKDFACISKNLEYLNCSWTTPDLIIYTNYSLSFLTQGYTVFTKSIEASYIEGSLTRYCIYNGSSYPAYRQQFETYRFYLDSINKFGNNKQIFDIDHFSIVKPDPPVGLTAVSTGPHYVVLVWSLPNNIADFLVGGVEHKIEYQIAKIDNTSFFRQVNTSSLPASSRTYKFNITGLEYAHMQYGVRVYIKPVKAVSDKFWSEFSNFVFYTNSEKPSRPPETIAGAFRQNVFQSYRVVNIYWKQLEEYEEAGANFTYKVIVKYGSKYETCEPEKDRSMGFLTLNKATLNDMHIFVYSSNEKGSSDNSSYLYIPSERETRSLDVNSFSKLAYENGTYELSWHGRGEIDNYTLFWCQHNVTDTCNGRINFTVLSPKLNKYVIDLPKNNRYQFAISANKGITSSGMAWAKCHISKDEIAMFRFPIEFADHDAPEKTYVTLKWSMDCILKEGIILGYNISYCAVIETSSICDKTDRNHSKYVGDPKQMSTTIENLEPYKTYQFTMIVHTSLGAKTIDNSTVRITTPEDRPSMPQNVAISDIRNSSFTMSWDRPQHLNGHISKISYEIFNHGEIIKVLNYHQENLNMSRITWKLEGPWLRAFTNYSMTVRACNVGINNCSDKTSALTFRTCMGAPSKMEAAEFEADSNRLTWKPPSVYGGLIDQYQIKIIRDDRAPEIINTTNLYYPLPQCQEGANVEKYQVRAVNFDEDSHYGAMSDSMNVTLPTRDKRDSELLSYAGEWSDESRVLCGEKSSWFLGIIILGVLAMIAAGCGILKAYKKIRKMRDIKPEFPKGLLPEKDLTIYPSIYPSEKDEKPTSDEMLLLPNSKNTSISADVKQKDGTNCGSSEHTDSTALSDASQGPVDRQNSTSDDDSHSSLHLQIEPIKSGDDIEQSETSNSNSDSSKENSPYFSDPGFKKNKVTGYLQSLPNTVKGYVQSAPSPFKNNQPQIAISPSGSSSYVMAGLPLSAFPNSPPPATTNVPPASSGYVQAEDAMPRSVMNFPKLGPSPTKIFGNENLPSLPNLPPPSKCGADSSYIQLQSLDSLPSQKLNKRDVAPKPASNGYISPEDAVLNKHFKNIMSGGQIAEESAILDPAMSPDAYCRFSWSTDPANDNLNSLLGNSSTINPSKN